MFGNLNNNTMGLHAIALSLNELLKMSVGCGLCCKLLLWFVLQALS